MKILTYKVNLPVAAVRDEVKSQTEDWSFRFGWPFCGKHRLFHGEVWDNEFCVKLIIDHRNSFLPVAHGRMEPTLDGTIIRIRFKPGLFGVTFILLWTMGWTWKLIDNASNASPNQHQLIELGLSIGMILVAWPFMFAAIGMGIDEYERAFQQVFNKSLKLRNR